ncbi:FG-GAP-like repeat-containing protein [Myxococcota bacterium]|nr:FG-GAP-like repeat-containing protein [Myxococcota bacterium]
MQPSRSIPLDVPVPEAGRPGPLAWLRAVDPRHAIALILFSYLVLGFTVLGFNRTPLQAAVTSASACALEVLLARVFKKQWVWPLSALITSFSLSILLNYSHDYFLLLVPVYFAIGSKYLFTYRGRHFFNPALAGIAGSLFFASEVITAAPAYQWNGIASMSVFIVMLAVIFLLPQVKRGALVASFLVTYTLLTALRAFVMRYHLPFETLFLGTLSSPAFLLFTFFMITDPATSPADRRTQVKIGVALAVVDLALHLKQSYFTFFYAAILVASARFVWLHVQDLRASGVAGLASGLGAWAPRAALLGGLALGAVGLYRGVVAPDLAVNKLDWRFAKIPPSQSGIDPKLGDTLERTDPRVQHVAKWLISVGDAVAAGDFDADGRIDLFFTFPLKRDGERSALYRNLGDFRFERVPLPAIEARARAVEQYGINSAAMFVDLDSDGDLDLFLSYAFGPSVLLQNRLREDGVATFVDVTEAKGLADYSVSMGANALDVNGDGRLDLFVGNVLPTTLPGYSKPTRLNLFDLPEPEYPGDERMFDFMHSSWHLSNNGGENQLYLQGADGNYQHVDSTAWGLPETRWTLALGTGDFDQDGRTDVYVANDFGPDDLYLNRDGRRFENVKGTMFGSIGRDTYKGMNASVADVDRNGWLDVYVSNVHHALQAEGSLLPGEGGRPKIEDRATALGALNETRFGWGASLTDFDNDGWVDIAQANGMVDDTIDKKFEECPDYWYVNEKIARSPPSIHTMANKWGDIRGYCIYGKERNRLYLNRGAAAGKRFVDAAEALGLTERTNSRGMAAVDLDGDGRRDLVVTHQFGPPSIYRNLPVGGAELPAWVALTLVGDGERCNRQGLGSRVRVRYTDASGATVEQVREAQAMTGFSAQDDGRIHFGLGPKVGEVEVFVRWCGAAEVRHGTLAARNYHVVEQRSALAAQ